MKKVLIVGVDPGTTVGYAILDVSGNCLEMNSQKELSADGLIQILTRFGKPLIIGTDKAKTPSYVQKIATAFNAVIAKPSFDLTVEGKQQLVNLPADNIHEKDALASANYALKKSQSIINRVQKTLEDNQHLFEEALVLVVQKKISVRDALKILTTIKPSQVPFPEKVTIEQKQKTREVELLKRANEYLRNENAQLHNIIEQKPTIFKNIKLPAFTETYAQTIAKLKKILFRTKNELNRLEKLSTNQSRITIPRIINLGTNQVQKIQNTRIIYVDNPAQHSEKTLHEIQDITIISAQKPTFPVNWVDAKKLKTLILLQNVASVRQDEIRILATQKTISQIIEEYRKERI